MSFAKRTKQFFGLALLMAGVLAIGCSPQSDPMLDMLEADLKKTKVDDLSRTMDFIFSEIPEKLVGRSVVMVANLKPRQMKFGLSEGMVCASGPGGEEVFLLSPDDGAKPGQRVH